MGVAGGHHRKQIPSSASAQTHVGHMFTSCDMTHETAHKHWRRRTALHTYRRWFLHFEHGHTQFSKVIIIFFLRIIWFRTLKILKDLNFVPRQSRWQPSQRCFRTKFLRWSSMSYSLIRRWVRCKVECSIASVPNPIQQINITHYKIFIWDSLLLYN